MTYDSMKVRKSLRIEHRKSKPLMLLKDYLLDDLSSCSSSGFMSFPRTSRRSSTAASIRILLDIDLRTGILPSSAKTNKKNCLNGASSSSSSRFRTAAIKLVNAVKSPLWNTCFLPHSGSAATKLLTSETKDVVTLGMSSFGGENSIVPEKNEAATTGAGGMDSKDCIGGEATNTCFKECLVLMGKEQFSPVSVLDYPFDEDYNDDDVETDTHTRRGEGSREDAQEKDETEAMLERMLKTMKADILSYDSKADVLILDYFREKMEEGGGGGGGNGYMALWGWERFEDEVVQKAEEWVREEEARETYSGWEMEGGRIAYLKDMERGKVRWNEMGNHKSHEDSERHEVCLEVEDVVWTLLVNEVLIDIFGMV